MQAIEAGGLIRHKLHLGSSCEYHFTASIKEEATGGQDDLHFFASQVAKRFVSSSAASVCVFLSSYEEVNLIEVRIRRDACQPLPHRSRLLPTVNTVMS